MKEISWKEYEILYINVKLSCMIYLFFFFNIDYNGYYSDYIEDCIKYWFK